MAAEGMSQPKKPPTSYFLFRMDKCTDTETKKTAAEWGVEWKALSAEVRRPYEEQAATLKAKYIQELDAFRQAGGTVQRAKRGEKKRAKLEKAEKKREKKAKGGKNNKDEGGTDDEEKGGTTLQEMPHANFLQELGRRFTDPEFVQLYSNRLLAEPPEAKRQKIEEHESTTVDSDVQGPSGRDLQKAFLAAKVGDDEEKGFKHWLTQRWDKFSNDVGNAKPKQLGRLAADKWARMADEKKAKWSAAAEEE